MLFEIKNAKLVEVTDIASGTSKSGNEWTRATAVFEKVEGNYTETYPILVFGEKIQDAQALVGQAVDVKYNVQSRKYNGRFYTDLNLRFIAPAAGTVKEAQKAEPVPAPAPKQEKKDDAINKRGLVDDPDADLPF